MIYFGFDLGDGESCVAWSRDIAANEPTPIAVAGDLSFTSAVAMLDGIPVIGRLAAAENDRLEDLHVCFKRHFLENRPEINLAVKRFAQGVMASLRQNTAIRDRLDNPEEVCFIVGCPAGWGEEDRTRYRQLLTEAGMPGVRLASESRAAFENALRRRMDGVRAELIEDCVLVIDIGSSTLDLAYVCDGQEHQVEIMGDVKLGGGLMDEMILEHALHSLPSPAREQMQAFLESSPAWHSRVMLEARAIKERYFQREEQYYASNETLEKFIRIPGMVAARGLTLRLNPEIVETYLTAQPHPLLDAQSFKSRLRNALKNAHQEIRAREPKLVILTGGPSRMRFFREMCEEEFAASTVIVSSEPEFDIARGLAYAGSVDEGAARLLYEMRQYIEGSTVEEKVAAHLDEMISDISDVLAERLLKRCVLKAFCAWRGNRIDTLQHFEDKCTETIAQYLKSAEGQQTIEDACKPWTQMLMGEIQRDLDDIARRHNVSLGQLQAGRIRVSRGEEVTRLDMSGQLVATVQATVTVITGIVMGMICGGAGTALIATGIVGIIAGVIIAAAAVFLGKDFVKGAVMNLNIPPLLRKLLPDSTVVSPRNQQKAADMLIDALSSDAALIQNLTTQISTLIDTNLAELLRSSEVQIVA